MLVLTGGTETVRGNCAQCSMLNAQCSMLKAGPKYPMPASVGRNNGVPVRRASYLPWINSNQSKLQLLSETIGGRAVLLWGTQIHNAALES
jgi:hypothetical protein